MELENIFDTQRDKDSLVEWRGRIKKSQLLRLKDLENRLDIPASALVRIAIDCFLPKLTNCGFKEEGIKNLWNDQKF